MKSRAGKRHREEKDQKRKSKRTEDTDARKGRKVAKHCVFPMICGSGGSKSRLAKAAGAEPAGQRRDEKLHAVVARSTFPSENVQNTPFSDHFWKLRRRKSARRCGAKHISKSKCTKHLSVGPLLEVEMSKSARRCGVKHISKSKVLKTDGLGPLLEVEMSKKCTPLWREAHFQVKMYKTLGVRTTFGGSDVASLQYTTLQDITLRYTTLHNTTTTTTQLHNYTPLHSTTLHYTTLHYTTLNYTTLHYITLHYTPLHYITLHDITFHYTSLHYTTLHYTPLHYNYNYTPLH